MLLFLLPMVALCAGKAYSQDLMRYDMQAFEKTVKNTDGYKENSLLLPWAKDVFHTYSERTDIKVKFTEKDFKDVQKALDDSTKMLKTLRKNYSSITQLKVKAEEDLKQEKLNNKNMKFTCDSTQRALQDTIKKRDRSIASYSNLVREVEEKDRTIANLNAQIGGLNTKLETLEAGNAEKDGQLTQLTQDKERLEGENNTLEREKQALEEQLTQKDVTNANLNANLTTLQQRNTELESRIAEYDAVFKDTKNVINGIYESNRLKPFADMNPNELERAISTYNGMRPLLTVVPSLLNELEGKVKEMSAWKAMIEPEKGARQYMKGKYDDKERKNRINEITKITMTGDKVSDKNDLLSLLNDQALVKDNYDKIVRNLEEKGCLPNEEKLKDANAMFNRMTKDKPFIHENAYESYDRAIRMIREELEKPAPSARVKTAEEYEKFIATLKAAF